MNLERFKGKRGGVEVKGDGVRTNFNTNVIPGVVIFRMWSDLDKDGRHRNL